jgi:hypothetical protein
MGINQEESSVSLEYFKSHKCRRKHTALFECFKIRKTIARKGRACGIHDRASGVKEIVKIAGCGVGLEGCKQGVERGEQEEVEADTTSSQPGRREGKSHGPTTLRGRELVVYFLTASRTECID